MKKRMYHPIKPWHVAMMVLGVVASGYSWYWSLNILRSLFDTPTGILLASMVTVVEIYSLMQLILTHNPAWLLGVVPGFIMSIAGSYGNFQMNYEQNVAKSTEYQRKERQIATLENDRDAALKSAQEYDKTKQPWYAKPLRKEAKDLQLKIDNRSDELKFMNNEGVGSSNALFRSIARHSDMSTLDAAEQSHLALGMGVEIFMLVCTVIGVSAMKKGYAFVRPNEDDYSVSWDEEGNPIYSKSASKPTKTKEAKTTPPPQEVQPAMAEKKDGKIYGFVPPQEPEKKMPVGIKNSNEPYPDLDKVIAEIRANPDISTKELLKKYDTHPETIKNIRKHLVPAVFVQPKGGRDYSAIGAKGHQGSQNNREKRIKKLGVYINRYKERNNEMPSARKMMDHIKISSYDTLKKYLNKLGY